MLPHAGIIETALTASPAVAVPQGGHFATDVMTPYPGLLDKTFAFSAGYSLHDMVVMALHGEPASMWMHHLITAVGTFLMMVGARMRARC